MEPVPSSIAKTYPARGPLKQYRFVESTAFNCFRCGESKKSKLITVYGSDWNRRLCNGCYGRLLSLYEVKAGNQSDDEKAEALSSALLALVPEEETRRAQRLLVAADNRAEALTGETRRFLATSEFVASNLAKEPLLEWSPAVIGLCKAVETEVIGRLIRPLAETLEGNLSQSDLRHPDLSRVANYCQRPQTKPPELGAISHFLRTIARDRQLRQGSSLVEAFFQICSEWPGADWLLTVDGLASSLSSLSRDYRNPAAHLDELSNQDYSRCRDLVLGSNGVMWKLLVATKPI